MVIVRKLKRDTNDHYASEYWLKVWKKYSLTTPSKCSVMGCCEHDLIGAQIQNVDRDTNSYFIIPLCRKHAKFESSLLVYPDTPMIPIKVENDNYEKNTENLLL